MSSGELHHNDRDTEEPASTEVQFALVIARMIETVNKSPDDMRQAIYDLARYKLLEQFNHGDVKEMKRAQQALETAIRGVEQFSATQKPSLPPPPPLAGQSLPPPSTKPPPSPSRAPPPPAPPVQYLPPPEVVVTAPSPRPKPPPRIDITPRPAASRRSSVWSPIKRTVGLLLVAGMLLLAFQQRERLAALSKYWPKQTKPVTAQVETKPAPAEPAAAPAPRPAPAKPNPLQPRDYGVYAVSNDKLSELQLLPGRAPDVRVAVSAAIKTPGQTTLPDGHPKFIVFRRDAASSAAERAEVRIIAKVAREFSSDSAGKKLDDSDPTWVIRNVSFPFRSSPIPDSPEMYELHSEDPALELSPGRYALIIRGQAYDFTVPGAITDSRHCIERVVLTSGTLYTDCKKL